VVGAQKRKGGVGASSALAIPGGLIAYGLPPEIIMPLKSDTEQADTIRWSRDRHFDLSPSCNDRQPTEAMTNIREQLLRVNIRNDCFRS